MIKTTNMLLEELHTYANPKQNFLVWSNRENIFKSPRGVYQIEIPLVHFATLMGSYSVMGN